MEVHVARHLQVEVVDAQAGLCHFPMLETNQQEEKTEKNNVDILCGVCTTTVLHVY